MALQILKSSLPPFEFNDNKIFDNEIARIKGRHDNALAVFRGHKITTSDLNYTGAFLTEHAQQTDQTDILVLKDTTEHVSRLVADAEWLHEELELQKSALSAQYQQIIREKATRIYEQCGDMLTEMERNQAGNLERVRRAYKQQLADAISKLSSMFTGQKNLQLKMKTTSVRQKDDVLKLEEENLKLRDQVRTLRTQLENLEFELADQAEATLLDLDDTGRAKTADNFLSYPHDEPEDNKYPKSAPANGVREDRDEENAALRKLNKDFSKRRRTTNMFGVDGHQVETTERASSAINIRPPSGFVSKKEVAEFESKIAAMREVITTLEQDLKDREAQHDATAKGVANITSELANAKAQVEIWKSKYDEAEGRATVNAEKAEQMGQSSDRILKLLDQVSDLERRLEDDVRAARENAQRDAAAAQKDVMAAEKEKRMILENQVRLLKETISDLKQAAATKTVEELDVEREKAEKAAMAAEVARLKKEVERVHRMWEKKFAVLQKSLHALKDEMFLRHQMERTTAQLHTAAVAFGSGKPTGIQPQKRPLPGIGSSKSGRPEESFAVSASFTNPRQYTFQSSIKNGIYHDPFFLASQVIEENREETTALAGAIPFSRNITSISQGGDGGSKTPHTMWDTRPNSGVNPQ